MAKVRRSRTFFPMRISIPTLAGGVGRQSPAKRTPMESENIDNFLVSIEHSAEKRRGAKLLTRTDQPAMHGILKEIYGTDSTSTKDLWFHWYSASAVQRFLIIIDYSADPSSNDDMMWVYRVNTDGTFKMDSIPDIEEEHKKYLTWGNGVTDNGPSDGTTYTADQALRAVAVGSSILILNTVVKAGYTSVLDADGETWKTVDYNGEISLTEATDPVGRSVEYETTVTVDPENIAESWNPHQQYISEDRSYDRNDPLDTGANDHIYGIWKVKDTVSGIVGPSDMGVQPRSPVNQLTATEVNYPLVLTTGGGIGDEYFDVQGFASGSATSKATAEIQLMTFRAVGSGPNSYRAASITDTMNEDATETNIAEYDGTLLELTHVLETGLTETRTIILQDARDAGILEWTDWEDEKKIILGTGGIYNYHTLANTIVTAINRLSNFGGEVDVTDDVVPDPGMILHYTAETNSRGTGIIINNEYYPDQWERDTVKDEEGNPVLDEFDAPTYRYTKYILASDYYYPDPEKPYLGQAVQKFSDLKFPPTTAALGARNNAEDMIKALYPDVGDADGDGKIYYLNQPYLGLSEGHYRVKDTENQPYLHVVRTPDGMSIIDKKRMPKQLVIEVITEEDGTPTDPVETKWVLRHVDWDERTSGSIESNPGPSIFHDGDGNAVQNNITAMSFYRDRLFLASEDKVVSSRLGNFDNFWLFDPNNITVNDPIDLSVSSNSFTPITYLQPYRSFLFLATSGNTQYELLGSENQISPLTAEISPTSFFGMAENTEPILMNNNLFFFDKRRLYIYFGEQSDTQQQALELSMNAPNYLPENYLISPTVSSDTSSMFIVDKDNSNDIYVYTNRVSGDQILQNSFYRFKLSSEAQIRSVKALDEFLYVVSEETTASTTNYPNAKYLTLRRIPLNNLELSEPRLDHLALSTGGWFYDPSTDRTSSDFSQSSSDIDTIVIGSGDYEGMVFDLTVTGTLIPNTGITSGYVSGDYADILNNATTVWSGKKYLSEIELSPQFFRSQEQVAVNGTLNLRYGLFRFRNSGNFNVEISRQGRTAKVIPFLIDVIDDRDVNLSTTNYKSFGLFKAPILGYADDLSLKIKSNNIHPMAVTNIEFVGKFKTKVSLLGG